MTPIKPTPEIFETERVLWNARIYAMLGMKHKNFDKLAKDTFELAHQRWVDFCVKNGWAFIPASLGF